MASTGGVIGWFRVAFGACTWLAMAATVYWLAVSHVKIASHIRQLDEMQHHPSTTRQNTEAWKEWEQPAIVQEKQQYSSPKEIKEQQATAEHAKNGRPALHTILTENNTVIGDASWLLNFGIIGYGKCGTSTMMVWLNSHPEIRAFSYELKELMVRMPGLMIRRLYTELEAGPFQRGYKAPQDISQIHVMDYYRQYWPSAKLIVGVRHPVKWMESLYNFRVQNIESDKVMPHPNKLIGNCQRGMFHTCTNKGDFAFSLLKLGKQNYPEYRPAGELEKRIMSRYPLAHFNSTSVPPMENPLFLFDLEQLGDTNATRQDIFRHDVTKFMGLNEPLPALPHQKPGRMRSSNAQKRLNKMKIDICDDEYKPLRDRLMEHAIDASILIRSVLLRNPTVVVSSPDFFDDIMQRWMVDPCTNVTAAFKILQT